MKRNPPLFANVSRSFANFSRSLANSRRFWPISAREMPKFFDKVKAGEFTLKLLFSRTRELADICAKLAEFYQKLGEFVLAHQKHADRNSLSLALTELCEGHKKNFAELGARNRTLRNRRVWTVSEAGDQREWPHFPLRPVSSYHHWC